MRSSFDCARLEVAGMLRAFSRDERGTSMTEFVICLPVFVIFFIGVVQLQKVMVPMAVVEARAHTEAFDQALIVQNQALGSSMVEHTIPTIAGGDAISQTIDAFPRQPEPYRDAIDLAEYDTYSFGGLGLSGHFGESHARTRVPRLLGLSPAGVSQAIGTNSAVFVGGSVLGRQIVDDGPNTNFDGDQIVADSESTVATGLSIMNAVISATGMRAPLAAGIRYGTESGFSSLSVDTRYGPVDLPAWYTVTVPTYVADDAWQNGMRATTVSRLTLADHAIYNNLGAFSGDPTRIGLTEKQQRVTVSRPDQIPLNYPLDYQAGFNE